MLNWGGRVLHWGEGGRGREEERQTNEERKKKKKDTIGPSESLISSSE